MGSMNPELHEILESGAVHAARALLGYKLVYTTEMGRIAGYIAETEAYIQKDPASHSFRGETLRNASMFGPAGTIYIYFTYGMHYCLNIVTGKKEHGEAVLIRAIEPAEGLDSMKANRNGINGIELTNGPAKLVEALGIDPGLNGQATGKEISIEQGMQLEESMIYAAKRIGISKATEELARFYIRGNPYVSRS